MSKWEKRKKMAFCKLGVDLIFCAEAGLLGEGPVVGICNAHAHNYRESSSQTSPVNEKKCDR